MLQAVEAECDHRRFNRTPRKNVLELGAAQLVGAGYWQKVGAGVVLRRRRDCRVPSWVDGGRDARGHGDGGQWGGA